MKHFPDEPGVKINNPGTCDPAVDPQGIAIESNFESLYPGEQGTSVPCCGRESTPIICNQGSVLSVDRVTLESLRLKMVL